MIFTNYLEHLILTGNMPLVNDMIYQELSEILKSHVFMYYGIAFYCSGSLNYHKKHPLSSIKLQKKKKTEIVNIVDKSVKFYKDTGDKA